MPNPKKYDSILIFLLICKVVTSFQMSHQLESYGHVNIFWNAAQMIRSSVVLCWFTKICSEVWGTSYVFRGTFYTKSNYVTRHSVRYMTTDCSYNTGPYKVTTLPIDKWSPEKACLCNFVNIYHVIHVWVSNTSHHRFGNGLSPGRRG